MSKTYIWKPLHRKQIQTVRYDKLSSTRTFHKVYVYSTRVYTRIIINNMFAVCSSLHVTCSCLSSSGSYELLRGIDELYPPHAYTVRHHKLSPRGLFRVCTVRMRRGRVDEAHNRQTTTVFFLFLFFV